MRKIRILAIGGLKEKFFADAQKEYLKRMSRFADITVTELKEAPLPADPSQKEIEVALEKEAGDILARLRPGEKVVALAVEGGQMTSPEFSAVPDDSAGRPVTFIIGSSYGLSPRVKAAADLRLSLSELTFPHQLARVMLLEQIYRAFKIRRGETYHK